jgi:hypothetical protein
MVAFSIELQPGMKGREMHINVLAALVGTAILAAPIQSTQAQYVIPNVNTGTKSNIPVISPPRSIVVPDVVVPNAGSSPQVDARCRELTDAQRRETPGCH